MFANVRRRSHVCLADDRATRKQQVDLSCLAKPNQTQSQSHKHTRAALDSKRVRALSRGIPQSPVYFSFLSFFSIDVSGGGATLLGISRGV